MEKVIVLGHGKPYDFKGTDGNQLKGVKVSYVSDVPLSGLDGAVGFLPIQVNLDPSVLNDIKQVPGLYEIGYAFKPGKNNRPEAVVNSLKLIKAIDIQTLCKA